MIQKCRKEDKASDPDLICCDVQRAGLSALQFLPSAGLYLRREAQTLSRYKKV